ncbi:cystathionine gamma-lyase [Aphelenchoides avenae]|nr:cystathionine gamma-lyase [Aphelenchus avenae]
MQSHMENALAIARWLETNPRVEMVLYPELPSHPNYVVHKKQSMGMSGMVSFYIDGGLDEAHKFLTNLKLFTPATSLGGCESLAEAPFTMQPAVTVDGAHSEGITPNLIRLSVGCENKGDLIMDLEDALRKAVG